MVGSVIIIYKSPSWTYRTVEVAIMIGMFQVWNSTPGMYFTNFIEYFKINLFSAIPFFEYDETKTQCSAAAFLFFNGISCFVYNNLRRYVPTLVAWLILAWVFVNIVIKKLINKNKSAQTSTSVINSESQQQMYQKHVIDLLYAI